MIDKKILKYKKIIINLDWETEDNEPPPMDAQENTASVLRGYLHNKGMEGNLKFIEKDGKTIPSLEILFPEDWAIEDVQSFVEEVRQYLETAFPKNN